MDNEKERSHSTKDLTEVHTFPILMRTDTGHASVPYHLVRAFFGKAKSGEYRSHILTHWFGRTNKLLKEIAETTNHATLEEAFNACSGAIDNMNGPISNLFLDPITTQPLERPIKPGLEHIRPFVHIQP